MILFAFYFLNSQGVVSIDTSEISAPIIILAPQTPGVLEKVFVTEGQLIPADVIVAQVSGLSIRSKIEGLVISVQDTPGQIVGSSTPVVRMIDPKELKVVGHLEENKGLSDVHVGQKVSFSVDAFGSKKYYGVVDSISPTSRQSDVVFSISDNRQENYFNVYVKFDFKG